jgi:hypothetical protein
MGTFKFVHAVIHKMYNASLAAVARAEKNTELALAPPTGIRTIHVQTALLAERTSLRLRRVMEHMILFAKSAVFARMEPTQSAAVVLRATKTSNA